MSFKVKELQVNLGQTEAQNTADTVGTCYGSWSPVAVTLTCACQKAPQPPETPARETLRQQLQKTLKTSS